MSSRNIQWHPGFLAGMEIEFKDCAVDFDKEYILTKGPLRPDLLIIKKLADDPIDNDIGNLFRVHNIIEYKSPDDELSIDTFYKVQGYACLYKALGETVNAVPADQITVSLFRDKMPVKMMRDLTAAGAAIREELPGVYYVTGAALFPTQIVVTSRLRPELHAVLRILRKDAAREDIRSFLLTAGAYTEPGDRQRADAVLQVSTSANAELYHSIFEEDSDMCQALREIMKEDLLQSEARGRVEGRAEGRVEGRVEGMEKLSRLINKLALLGRIDDAIRCARDPKYRDELMTEFQI